MQKILAKQVAEVLKTVLRKDANTASSLVFYQPKAPAELRRFKKNR